MKKTVAIGLFCSLGVAFLTGIFATSLDYETTQNLYMLSGLGLIVFGIWAGVLLLKK